MILDALTVNDDEQLKIALHTKFWLTLNRSCQKKVLIANDKGSITD